MLTTNWAQSTAMSGHIRVRRVEHSDPARVSDFCPFQGRDFDPVGSSVVLMAFADEKDQLPLGAAWLDQSNGSCVLRKMQVDPAWQHTGVGAALLHAAVATGASAEIWCLPWRHLIDFHASAGFALASPDSAPDHIPSRLTKHVGWGLDIVLKKRDPEA